MVIFNSFLFVYQRVNHHKSMKATPFTSRFPLCVLQESDVPEIICDVVEESTLAGRAFEKFGWL